MSATKGVALVTGCAQGIGRAIALRLASDGFHLGLCDLPAKREAVEELSLEISRTRSHAGSDIRTCISLGDVSAEHEVQNVVGSVVESLGGVNVLVNSAGIAHDKPFHEITEQEFDRVFAVNTKGTFFCYKHAAQRMLKQGSGGRIIGISSIAGKRGFALASTYSASKFAVRGLTQSVAAELGSHGITVNTVAPGTIDTPLMRESIEESMRVTGNDEGLVKSLSTHSSALGCLGKPSDVAGLVSYLASAESRFITGQTFVVDGGTVFD
ncbi:NAD(P)-binding protein [Coniophora puteana RWD-64-598 SS2]|uniref:NAD(P)-binding protein n=1 Tax=Coniophora puteana (strain RWD-64-598) TaxID=741705 RepID=A0A5M3M8F3_CONPW|nr:NAD(P)-binding protein [Coniophora puteana RWD-64-598 SS2]EIW75542.1 NAD(P)-binding protein [Coniophora puteana RWD-64-598 SS2]